MKAPVVALKQPGNHGPHAGSICKKICPQRPQPGKYDYFAQPESYSRSGAWEFFTEDLRQRERQLVEFNVQCEAAAAKVSTTAEKLGVFRERSEFHIRG